MNLQQCYFVNNNCYRSCKPITPKGIMLHSTGANNPNLKRYVGPDDGLLGKNQYNNHWNQARPQGKDICVHGFIGKLADGSVAAYQTLPWTMRGWHCAKSGNDTHIGIEICEDALDDKAYFNAVYREAVELFAHLCKLFSLDPLRDGVIVDHAEGYRRGIASNHADITHWLQKHGKNMDAFRAAVKAQLDAKTPAPTPPAQTTADTVYTVKKGDTLSAIAAKYATTYQALAAYNGIGDPDKLAVGQTLRIPAAKTAATIKKGGVVLFAGGPHYVSANAATAVGGKRTAGKARVTNTAPAARHPYHLVGEKGGSNVYGWVDAGLVKPA